MTACTSFNAPALATFNQAVEVGFGPESFSLSAEDAAAIAWHNDHLKLLLENEGYSRATFGHDPSASLDLPYSFQTLRKGLGTWLSDEGVRRYASGTFNRSLTYSGGALSPSQADKLFYVFQRTLEAGLTRSGSMDAMPPIAVIRGRRKTYASDRDLFYHFLIGVPEHLGLADMKRICSIAADSLPRLYRSPSHLIGCKSVWDWLDVLVGHGEWWSGSAEAIDSFAQWHWRMPPSKPMKSSRSGRVGKCTHSVAGRG